MKTEQKPASGYYPDGGCFVVKNGKNRYNRPLCGKRGFFFIYAGDRPEWALSRPGKCGNLLIGIVKGTKGKWLIEADEIVARYQPGFYTHEVKDILLGDACLVIQSVAMQDADGLVLRISLKGVAKDISVVWGFGGIRSLKELSPDFDTCGYTHESHFYPKPEDSYRNTVTVRGNTFVIKAPFLGEEVRYSNRKLIESRYCAVMGAATGGMRPLVADSRMFADITQGKRRPVRYPVVVGQYQPSPLEPVHIGIMMARTGRERIKADNLERQFDNGLDYHARVRKQITVVTPDPHLNAMVPSLCVAMDAVWDPPYLLHGRIHNHEAFLGWRCAYGTTALGWFERSESHFRAFAKTQALKTPKGCEAPRMDARYELARQEDGRSILNSKGQIWTRNDGYRALNMQEVFVDMALTHYLHTGDERFIRDMYPVIERHLDWEKRCFDPDGDGLYENYANVHTSDAVSYNGAGCAVASAYNHRANRMMAEIAERLGRDGTRFRREADKIKRAMERLLWLRGKGIYAECRDYIGLRLVHESAATPSIYHVIEAGIPDRFQAWQMVRYLENDLENVPCGRGKGALVSFSNWVPWWWSVRQLMPIETVPAALAAWQAGQPALGYRYFMGAMVNSMFESRLPGGALATSPLDKHIPGIATDFTDMTGMACRTLVEGLFGIRMNLPEDKVTIDPGFPHDWNAAEINTPYISYAYSRDGKTDVHNVSCIREVTILLRVGNPTDKIPHVTVNGRERTCRPVPGMGRCAIEVGAGPGKSFEFRMEHRGEALGTIVHSKVMVSGERAVLEGRALKMLELKDPRQCLAHVELQGNKALVIPKDAPGRHCFFVKARQDESVWWAPVEVDIHPPIEMTDAAYCEHDRKMIFKIKNNMACDSKGMVRLAIPARGMQRSVHVSISSMKAGRRIEMLLNGRVPVPGTYRVTASLSKGAGKLRAEAMVPVFDAGYVLNHDDFEMIPLISRMNGNIENIFKQEYRSPRSPFCSLQVPLTGYGEWCYGRPNTRSGKAPEISAVFFQRRVNEHGAFVTPQGIPFHSPGGREHNAILVSQWDNFPSRVEVDMGGVRAKRIYFLVAGSTHAMVSQMDNARVTIMFHGGARTQLGIHNPRNYWPIQDDYDVDADSFCIPKPYPQRVLIGECNTKANLLDMELDGRAIEKIVFECLANEIVVGLLGVTVHIDNK